MYKKMCEAVSAAAEELPKYKAGKGGPKRKVSEKTKALYDRRTKLHNPTKQERNQLQKEIRESGLTDFKAWVEECADTLMAANNVGNTKKIYKTVNKMEGKKTKPPKNLTTNKQGELLTCATDVQAVPNVEL